MSTKKQNKSKHGSFEDEYISESSNKIELANGKCENKNCEDLLAQINKSYKEYYKFYRIKDYGRAIKSLERAYMNSFDLRQPQCIKCTDLFRKTIIQSLEEMHKDLKKQTRGLFWSKRNRANFDIIDTALNSLKKKINPPEL